MLGLVHEQGVVVSCRAEVFPGSATNFTAATSVKPASLEFPGDSIEELTEGRGRILVPALVQVSDDVLGDVLSEAAGDSPRFLHQQPEPLVPEGKQSVRFHRLPLLTHYSCPQRCSTCITSSRRLPRQRNQQFRQ